MNFHHLQYWQQRAQTLKIEHRLFIDGRYQPAAAGKFFAVEDPAGHRELAQVARGEAADIDRAVSAARAVFERGDWAQAAPAQRKATLLRFADLMEQHHEELALLETLDTGKPIRHSLRDDVPGAIRCIRWYAEAIDKVYGEIAPTGRDALALIEREPIGVVGAIVPWNFPLMIGMWKVMPALAAGCTIIVKPAEQTPLTALALAKLAQDAGIPAGVLQVVTGEAAQVGKVLCDSPVVRKLSFTGSTEVGRILMAQCAPSIKKLSLELGGNAPVIVFDDANLDAAVAGIMASKFRNSGQTCVCANRIYVQDGIYERLAEKLVAAVEQLKVGDGSQEGTTQGPLIDSDAVAKVQSHIDDALIKGAQIATGGQPHALGGTFFQPTVVTGVTQKMRFAKEETFGPVAPLFRFHDEAEAIAMANDTEFGLAAYLFTQNAARQWRVPEALEYGMVGINTGLISNEVAPFGGVKQSGLGREGSRYGIEEYLELKYLCIDVSR